MASLNNVSAGGWPVTGRTAPDVRNAGRRGWVASALLVVATIGLAIASYSISVRVAAEKREVESLARTNRALESDIKALNAELRVRMRMPQLQRWNDETLGLMPISAHQYLEAPVSLVAYGRELPNDAPPVVTYAVRDVGPAGAANAPRVLKVAAADDMPARKPAVVQGDSAPQRERRQAAPAQLPGVVMAAAPTTRTATRNAARPERPDEAPADLLRQVAMLGDGHGQAEN